MIENEPNELTLIFHSDKPNDQRTRAYVETLGDYVIKTLDLKRESLTETQLAEVANKVGSSIQDLVDTSYLDQTNLKSIDGMPTEDLLTLIRHEPVLLHTPILIIGKHAFQYVSAYDMIKEGASDSGLGNINGANIEERASP